MTPREGLERMWVKGSGWFLKDLFQSVLPKHLAQENSLVLECMCSHKLRYCRSSTRVYEASAWCYSNPASITAWPVLLNYVCVLCAWRCFDVNRNLIPHFLLISWSCHYLALCICHIVYISNVWVCDFVVCVCECSLHKDTFKIKDISCLSNSVSLQISLTVYLPACFHGNGCSSHTN